jgi:hypothetical protein
MLAAVGSGWLNCRGSTMKKTNPTLFSDAVWLGLRHSHPIAEGKSAGMALLTCHSAGIPNTVETERPAAEAFGRIYAHHRVSKLGPTTRTM